MSPSNISMCSRATSTRIHSVPTTRLIAINAQYVSQYTDLPDTPGVPDSFTSNLHVWDTGIVLYGSGNVLQNSVVEWSAGSGVVLVGSNNTVRNTLIDHVDYIGSIAACGNQRIGRGAIGTEHHDLCLRRARSLDKRLLLWRTCTGASDRLEWDIGYNNVFSTMMLSRDGGAVYTWDKRSHRHSHSQ